MFFNHLSSRNDPLHKAHKEKITPKAECTDAIAKALQHAAPGTPGANLTHADNRGVSAATRARRLAWAPAVPGAAASSAAAVAALRNATGVSLAWNSPSGVADTINLNTTPAADYDLSICDSVSIECLKRLHLQSQDFPDNKEYRAKIRSVLEFGMKAFGGNPNAPGTEDGARGAIFVVASTILVTCRPSGSPRYTTDQMVERAATIAHSPDGFLALWKELALSASVPPTPLEQGDAADSPGPSQPSMEQMVKRAHYYANRGEFGKAWAAFSPSAPADGRDPKVVANYLGKTPQARAPPASVTADEPGVARYELKRKFFNKFAKSLPRARKGGPTQVDYELVRIITESTDGADCLFNFCTSVGWGVMHERLKRLEDDLNAVCLWKDDGVSCRPLGLCSIFTRSAERCIALQERDWAEQFCTTQLPEVAKARAEALEDATVTTATAEAAYTSRCITHGLDSTEAKTALADLEAAEAAEERARAPVNFPKNYAFSKNGTHLYAHTVAGWHGTKPENATISGDKENFYNTIAQALTADNKPDPNGCGRVKLLDWIRKRRPDLLPVARLIMGTPSFIRLVKAEGALRLPSADGDDLDLSAADWDPLSLECPDYNDPNYAKSACGVIQGRALSTILSVCFLHDICHEVRDNPTMRPIGFADDICQNDEPSRAVAAYSGPKGLLEAQKKGASVFDGVGKSLIYSPEGDLSCAPGWLRGSPAHRDKEGKPTGRVDCFKAVGTFFGDPEACKKELTAHLRKN